eukprot:11481400-Heterocapsa_arctica.AAC.1
MRDSWSQESLIRSCMSWSFCLATSSARMLSARFAYLLEVGTGVKLPSLGLDEARAAWPRGKVPVVSSASSSCLPWFQNSGACGPGSSERVPCPD